MKGDLLMKQIGRTPQPLTDKQKAIAKEYLESNLSYIELGEKHSTPASTIIYWVKKYRKELNAYGENNQ